jgi:hypothetical protein
MLTPGVVLCAVRQHEEVMLHRHNRGQTCRLRCHIPFRLRLFQREDGLKIPLYIASIYLVGTVGYPKAGLIRPICEVAQYQTNNMRPSTI